MSGIGRIHNQGWRFLANYRAQEATVQRAGVSNEPARPAAKKSSPMRRRRNFCAGHSVLATYGPSNAGCSEWLGPTRNRAGETMVNATPQATTGQQDGRTVLLQLLAEVARGNKSAFARLYGLTHAKLLGVGLRILERPGAGRGCPAGELSEGLAPRRQLRSGDRLADDLDGHHRQARRHRCVTKAPDRGVRQRRRDVGAALERSRSGRRDASRAAAPEGAGGVCGAARRQAPPDHAGLSQGPQPPRPIDPAGHSRQHRQDASAAGAAGAARHDVCVHRGEDATARRNEKGDPRGRPRRSRMVVA